MKSLSLIILFIFCSIKLISQTIVEQLSLTEKLAHSTVRIQVQTKDGYGTGTGFFFNFNFGDKSVPVILTNRHVIEGAIKGTVLLTLKTTDGMPDLNNHLPIEIDNFESRWIKHPDNNIDLVAMPIAPLLNEAEKVKKYFFFAPLTEDLLPSAELIKEMTSVEEILMVGYPIGLFDNIHNYPIFRKGITATHPSLDYNNRPEFIIDAACFPGSSGSPVFLFNLGNYTSRTGGTIIGTRFSLLGILYAGPMYNAKGKIAVVNIPTKNDTVLQTAVPTNLGFVIKSSEILKFKKVIEDIISGQ